MKKVPNNQDPLSIYRGQSLPETLNDFGREAGLNFPMDDGCHKETDGQAINHFLF